MIKKTGNKKNHERQYWLWVTRPKYYLDDDGSERSELDPSSGEDLWGSWTCHKDTKKGDLALLWRSRKELGKFLAKKGIITLAIIKVTSGYKFQTAAYRTDFS